MDLGRCRRAVVYLRRFVFCGEACFERSRDDPGADDLAVARDASGLRGIVFPADADGLPHLTQLQSLVWKSDGIESAAGAVLTAIAGCASECSDPFVLTGRVARTQRIPFSERRLRICFGGPDIYEPGMESHIRLVSNTENASTETTRGCGKLSIQSIASFSYRRVAVRSDHSCLEQCHKLDG